MHAQLDLRIEVAYFSTRDSFKEVVLSTWDTVTCAHMFTIHQLPSLIGLQAIPKLGGGGGGDEPPTPMQIQFSYLANRTRNSNQR